MAIPKKKGIREIKIGAVTYYWTFRTDYPAKTIKIRVGELDDQNKNLLIEAFYIDPWLTIGDIEIKKNEIAIVTPGFIRMAIDFALSNHWNEQENRKMSLRYENSTFFIKGK